MRVLAELAIHFVALCSCVQSSPTETNLTPIHIWRLDKLEEADSAGAPATEVSSLPRFLVVTDGKVFDLLFIENNGGYTAIHEKEVVSKTYRGSTQTLLIVDRKNAEKFALRLDDSKSDSILRTTLVARRGDSVFARVARCEYHIASDNDSIRKLELMLTHDRILDNMGLKNLIEAFLSRATGKDEE